MLVRGMGLSATMSKYLIDEIERTSNIELVTQTEVIGAEGNDHLEALCMKGPKGEYRVEASSLFVFIGAAPGVEWLPGCVLRDEKGFVLAGPDLRQDGKQLNGWTEAREPFLLETSVPGVFAVGDVRDGAVRRVANSVGEGSIVLYFIHQYLANR